MQAAGDQAHGDGVTGDTRSIINTWSRAARAPATFGPIELFNMPASMRPAAGSAQGSRQLAESCFPSRLVGVLGLLVVLVVTVAVMVVVAMAVMAMPWSSWPCGGVVMAVTMIVVTADQGVRYVLGRAVAVIVMPVAVSMARAVTVARDRRARDVISS